MTREYSLEKPIHVEDKRLRESLTYPEFIQDQIQKQERSNQLGIEAQMRQDKMVQKALDKEMEKESMKPRKNEDGSEKQVKSVSNGV